MPLLLQSVSSDSDDAIEWVATTGTTNTNDDESTTRKQNVAVSPGVNSKHSSGPASDSKPNDLTAATEAPPATTPIVVASTEETVDDSIGIELSYDSQMISGQNGGDHYDEENGVDGTLEDVDLEEADKHQKLQLENSSLSKSASGDEGVEIQHFDRASEGPKKQMVYPGKRNRFFARRGKRILKSLFVFLVVGAVGFIVSGVLDAKKEGNGIPAVTAPPESRTGFDVTSVTPISTMSPTQSPTHGGQFRDLFQKLQPVLGRETPSHDSLHYAVMDWMVNYDQNGMDFVTTPGWVILERFIVILLYFSTGAGTWINQLGFLSPDSVCTWNDLNKDMGILCDAENHVMEINLCKSLGFWLLAS